MLILNNACEIVDQSVLSIRFEELVLEIHCYFAERVLTPDWFVNSYVTVLYEKIFHLKDDNLFSHW